MDSRDAARPPELCIASIQTIGQVHMMLLFFCAACERRVDGFGATLAVSSSLETPLQFPTLKSQRKAKRVGYFPLLYQVFKVLH